MLRLFIKSSAQKGHTAALLPSLFLIYTLFWVSPFCLATEKVKDDALPPISRDLIPAENVSLPEYVILRPADQATFSSETVASVAALPFKEGSYFRKGDILLQLDCRVQQADLLKAQAQQKATNKAEQSANKLQSFGSISEFELVKATSDAQMANADVDRLSAIVEKCTIKAPYNGAVAELMIHEHETVKPGDPMLKIISMENLELEMQVPSSWLQWLHLDSTFYVHVNEINARITAKITKINPQIEPVSQTIKIIGTITKPDPKLLPGMSGQAIFLDNPANKHPKSNN